MRRFAIPPQTNKEQDRKFPLDLESRGVVKLVSPSPIAIAIESVPTGNFYISIPKDLSVKLRILLSIASIYMGVVGLGLIFAPHRFGVGAVPADASVALIAYLRLFGSPFLGIAVLDWMARNAEPSTARKAIIFGNIVGFAAIAALDVWGLFSGARQLTNLFAIVHLLFAFAFIWVGRMSMSSSKRSR